MRLLASCLLAASLASGEAAPPGPPAMAVLLQELRHDDFNRRARAQGWLFFLDRAGLAAVRADFDRAGSMRDGWEPLQVAEIVAGVDKQRDELVRLLINQAPAPAYTRLLSPAELDPLLDRVAAAIEPKMAKPAEVFPGGWLDLAASTRHPRLLGFAAALVAAGQPAAGRMQRLPAAEWLAVCAPLWDRLKPEQRLRLLDMPMSGIHAKPPAMLSAILADPALRMRGLRLLHDSSEPSVLDAASKLLGDPDPAIRSTAAQAILGFRNGPDAERLRQLADDVRVDAFVRGQAWSRLIAAGRPETRNAAWQTLAKPGLEPALYQMICHALVEAGETERLMAMLGKLPADRQAATLLALLRRPDPAALEAAARMISSAPDAQAVQVVQGLAGASRDIDSLPLLIGLLDDRREPVRTAALYGVQSRSGLGAPASADAKRTIAIWRRWHTLHRAVPDEAFAGELRDATEAIAGRGTATPRALLRLAGARGKESEAALRLLCATPGVAIDESLIESLDDPQFQPMRRQLCEAMAGRRPGPGLVTAVMARIGNDDALLRTACLWRQDGTAAAVTKAVLEQGRGDGEVRTELAAWWPIDLDRAVRAALGSGKPSGKPTGKQDTDPMRAVRAADLLIRHGQQADVAELVQATLRAGSAGASMAQAVVATHAPLVPAYLGKLLSDAKVPAEVAVMVLSVVARSRDPVPADLLPAVRLRLKGSDQRHIALAIAVLAAAGDEAAVGAIDSAKPEQWPVLAEAVLGVVRRDGTAAVAALFDSAPDRTARDRCLGWLSSIGGLDETALRRLREQMRADAERALREAMGKPVSGISVVVNGPIDAIPDDKGEIDFPVTFRNHRREAVEVVGFVQGTIWLDDGVTGLPHIPAQPQPVKLPANGTLKLKLRAFVGNGQVRAANRLRFDARVMTAPTPTTASENLVIPSAWVPCNLLSASMRLVDSAK